MNPVYSEFWTAIAIPLAGSAAASFLVELLLVPAPAVFGRPWRALAAHLGLWALAFCVYLLATQRPYFGALLQLAGLLLLVFTSNAKYRALREPFVFADFEYFTDTIRHPRLFLPYFGIGRAIAGFVAFFGAIYLGVAFEPSLPARTGWTAFLSGLGLLAAAGAGLLWLGTPRGRPEKFDASADLRRLGLAASLWQYYLAERGRQSLPRTSRFTAQAKASGNGGLPHIVAVQSESFFDARRLHAGVKPALLERFDAIRRSAVLHGGLHVPCWGGNTSRTEFAFLTGLGAEEIGVHRFNPNRRLAQQGLPSVASFLKRAGYRTVCVHPYPASFYSRDTAYPPLGFDRFIDIEDFREAERYGPYISDRAVTEKARAVLEESDQPVFLFLITMENHGPLHLEQVAPGDIERLYDAPPPGGYDDLTVYLRHLANADRMAHALHAHLERSPRDAWLCWYGDHVPILQQVYDATGFSDGRTDYFIWGKGRRPEAGSPRDVRAEELGALLLERAGLL
ncbi:MAG TPA: LTA synthase family protein [Burkholderiales bacterium]|nr:LTA synthase family protein [Burkholderiales bacterium]